jgi:hypothetical protein
VEDWIDQFIRSEDVANRISEDNSDFVNEPSRAGRIANGPEGSCETHREVIETWRACFRQFLRCRRNWEHSLDRFTAAVEAHFDAVEVWHEKHGTLDQELG